jgi:hypothetical protein
MTRISQLSPAAREARINGWVTLYADFGLGCQKIARRFGVHYTEVYKALKDRGVEMRLRYGKTKAERDGLAAEMYADYCSGLSLAEVGAKHGKTRQVVFDSFSRRGLPMRDRQLLPTVDFNGVSYTWNTGKRYYRRTAGSRSLLHHDVWRFHCGEIPAGHQVIHRDGDLQNNDISNLECQRIEDVSRFHHPPRSIPETRRCEYCGETLRRKTWGGRNLIESPSHYNNRMYCDKQCAGAHRRGKPKGWSPLMDQQQAAD